MRVRHFDVSEWKDLSHYPFLPLYFVVCACVGWIRAQMGYNTYVAEPYARLPAVADDVHCCSAPNTQVERLPL